MTKITEFLNNRVDVIVKPKTWDDILYIFNRSKNDKELFIKAIEENKIKMVGYKKPWEKLDDTIFPEASNFIWDINLGEKEATIDDLSDEFKVAFFALESPITFKFDWYEFIFDNIKSEIYNIFLFNLLWYAPACFICDKNNKILKIEHMEHFRKNFN